MSARAALWLLGFATLGGAFFTIALATVAHAPVGAMWFGGACFLILGVDWGLVLGEIFMHGWDNDR